MAGESSVAVVRMESDAHLCLQCLSAFGISVEGYCSLVKYDVELLTHIAKNLVIRKDSGIEEFYWWIECPPLDYLAGVYAVTYVLVGRVSSARCWMINHIR